MLTGPGMAEAYRKAGPYMGLGIEFAVTVILCFLAGRWLDGKIGSTPILALLGLLIGVGAATFLLIRSVTRLGEKDRKSTKAGSEEKTTTP